MLAILLQTLLAGTLLTQTPKTNTTLFPFLPDTGYITVYPENDNRMFYWHFPSKTNPDTAPILIWLQGGPGCASSGGLFFENGPFIVKNYTIDQKAENRPFAWNEKANLLFPDQPLGIGFSTVSEGRVAETATDIQEQFLLFFQGFLAKYPKYKGRPVFVSGESYGGHWIPYIGSALFYSNDPDINMKGLLIGNGYVYSKISNIYYPKFAYKYKNYTNLSAEKYTELVKNADLCAHLTDIHPTPQFAPRTYDLCNNIEGVINEIATKFNPTFSQYYMPGGWEENTQFLPFLNSEPVQKLLGVNKKFDSCNNTFGDVFGSQDYYMDAREYVVRLLGDGVRVWFYNGDLDMDCNYDMEEYLLGRMEWSGRRAWVGKGLEECVYGLCKEVLGLKYVRFVGAGHMVPDFKPRLCLDMVNEFMDWAQKGQN